MLEQFRCWRIVRSELHGFFDLDARKLRLFLFQVNARERGANGRGITRRQGKLQFIGCLVQFTPSAVDITQLAVRRGVTGVDCERSTKFLFGSVQTTRNYLLAPAPQVGDRG